MTICEKLTTLQVLITLLAVNCGCPRSESINRTPPDLAVPAQTEAGSTMNEQESGKTVTAHRIIEDAQETIQDASELADESKDEYLREMSEQLAEFDQRMADLQRKAAKLGDDSRTKWRHSEGEIHKRRQDVQDQIDRLQKSSEAAWQDLRQETASAWNQMQDAFEKATKHLNTPPPTSTGQPEGEEASNSQDSP